MKVKKLRVLVGVRIPVEKACRFVQFTHHRQQGRVLLACYPSESPQQGSSSQQNRTYTLPSPPNKPVKEAPSVWPLVSNQWTAVNKKECLIDSLIFATHETDISFRSKFNQYKVYVWPNSCMFCISSKMFWMVDTGRRPWPCNLM